MKRRRGLWVRLDVNFQDDPRLLRAGFAAELVYLRGLALVKRRGTDGFIAAEHLAALAAGLPGKKPGARAAAALVREGAWIVAGDGQAMDSRRTVDGQSTDTRRTDRVRVVDPSVDRLERDTGRDRSPDTRRPEGQP